MRRRGKAGRRPETIRRSEVIGRHGPIGPVEDRRLLAGGSRGSPGRSHSKNLSEKPMPRRVTSVSSHMIDLVRGLLPPCLVTGLLWITSNNTASLREILLAIALLFIPWISFLRWRRERDYDLPLFALISGMYWLFFAM